MKTQQRLLSRYLGDMQPGKLQWIGLRPERKAQVTVVKQAVALQGLGLEGDHRSTKTPGSGRQVTLISQEYIGQIAHFIGQPTIEPSLLRRNLVISGINLSALRYQQFAIGEAVFEANALCAPCSRMEHALGQGGVLAMLGHGGLCCKVLKGGLVRVSDQVIPLVARQQSLF